jgi:hypothetical protein
MFIYKILAHFAEMFPHAIDFGTDGINFNKSFFLHQIYLLFSKDRFHAGWVVGVWHKP